MIDIEIPKALPEKPGGKRLKRGSSLVKVIKLEKTIKKDGSLALSTKSGLGAFDVTITDKDGGVHAETYWLGEAAQWRVDKLFKAFGIDNTKKSANVSELMNKKAWVIMEEEFQTKNGVRIKDDKGRDLSYMRVKEFKEHTTGSSAPAVMDSDLIIEKETSSTAASAPKPVAASAPKPAQPEAQEDKPSKDETWESAGGGDSW